MLTYHFATEQAGSPEILVRQAAAPTIALSRPKWFYSIETSCSFPADYVFSNKPVHWTNLLHIHAEVDC